MISSSQFMFDQLKVGPRLWMGFQFVKDTGLHVRNELRLPASDKIRVCGPGEHALGTFSGEWVQRIMERLTEGDRESGLIDNGLGIRPDIRIQPKGKH